MNELSLLRLLRSAAGIVVFPYRTRPLCWSFPSLSASRIIVIVSVVRMRTPAISVERDLHRASHQNPTHVDEFERHYASGREHQPRIGFLCNIIRFKARSIWREILWLFWLFRNTWVSCSLLFDSTQSSRDQLCRCFGFGHWQVDTESAANNCRRSRYNLRTT